MTDMEKLMKALDNACEMIEDLKECTNPHAEENWSCIFREECEKGDKCLATMENFKKYLLSKMTD